MQQRKPTPVGYILQMAATKALHIEKLSVRADRIAAAVLVDQAWHYTCPELAKLVLKERPHLAFHACVNHAGSTFAAVIDHTPLPHLLEHMVVDILAHETPFEDEALQTTFVGTSEWTDRTLGAALVEVSYTDDLVALAAFKQAAERINELCSSLAQGKSSPLS